MIETVVCGNVRNAQPLGVSTTSRGLDHRYYDQHEYDELVDSLRYWAQITGVAGFRFDLAPVADVPLLIMSEHEWDNNLTLGMQNSTHRHKSSCCGLMLHKMMSPFVNQMEIGNMCWTMVISTKSNDVV